MIALLADLVLGRDLQMVDWASGFGMGAGIVGMAWAWLGTRP